MDMLDELTQWVITNNVPFIQEHTTVGHDTSSTTYSTTGGFSENSPYGPLNSISTFKNLAEAAVKKWNEQVDAQLGIPAQQALSTLSNNWIDAQTSFESPLKTKDTGTLSEFYQAEEAKL